MYEILVQKLSIDKNLNFATLALAKKSVEFIPLFEHCYYSLMYDQIVIWLIKAPLNLDRTKIGCKWNHKHAEQELLCLQDIKKEITGHPSRREIAPNKRKDERMKLSKKIQQRLQKDQQKLQAQDSQSQTTPMVIDML